MQTIINTIAQALVGIDEIKQIYIHTYRKQQKLTLEIILSTTVDQLSDQSNTLCKQRNFSVGEYNNSVIVELPYPTHQGGYGDDLDLMPNRSLKIWSNQLVQGLLQLNKKHLLDASLIDFYWASGHHNHSLGSNLRTILTSSTTTGDIVNELSLENNAALALCKHALVYLDGKNRETITHTMIEKFSYSDDSLVISTAQRKFDFSIEESDTNTEVSAYFESLYTMTRPDKEFKITSTADIPSGKSIEFYIELFNHYYTPGERDASKVETACEIAKIGMNHYPHSIKLLDTSTRTFLLSGNINEQYEYFKTCALTHTGLDSIAWNNLIANTVNSVVMLGDLAEMNDFFRLHYRPEQESAPRCYYHNMACLLTLLGQHIDFEPCMEKALANQETSAAIIGETDFDSIRETDAYQRILTKAIQQDKDRGDNDVQEPAVYSVYDYTEWYRLNEFHSLERIAQKRTLEAETFLRQLALDQLISNKDRRKAFFLLIALGGNDNLDVARKSHKIFGKETHYRFISGMSDILTVVKDKEEFKNQLTAIIGKKAERLFKHIK